MSTARSFSQALQPVDKHSGTWLAMEKKKGKGKGKERGRKRGVKENGGGKEGRREGGNSGRKTAGFSFIEKRVCVC